jgi:hypothetical protein
MGERMTPDEKRVVRALQRLAKSWPPSLWLFAGSGGVHVMRKNADGSIATNPDGGFDQSMCVEHIRGIEADGGDW